MEPKVKSHYGSSKLDKSSMLNESMSIVPTSSDEFEQQVKKGGN